MGALTFTLREANILQYGKRNYMILVACKKKKRTVKVAVLFGTVDWNTVMTTCKCTGVA